MNFSLIFQSIKNLIVFTLIMEQKTTKLKHIFDFLSSSERITLHGINSLLDKIQLDSLEIFSFSVAK